LSAAAARRGDFLRAYSVTGAIRVSRKVKNGTRRDIDAKPCIYFDGYWIRYYPPPGESLNAKQRLIDSLTRRLFHHTEHGINTPGESLDLARKAFDAEQDPARKRVNGAMLAGALFNRAADIFTTVVDLAEKGVHISPDNELMRACGDYFQEALDLGKTVKHYSGHEGIDELWGEPLKAFALGVEDFYATRYVKIAQTMSNIDKLGARMCELFADDPAYDGVAERIVEVCEAAKLESETIRTDSAIFEVWPRFVAAGEALLAFRPQLSELASARERQMVDRGMKLIADGNDLLTYISGARVPMPKSTREYLKRCDAYEAQRRGLPLADARRRRSTA
jgi:hypothetical protein